MKHKHTPVHLVDFTFHGMPMGHISVLNGTVYWYPPEGTTATDELLVAATNAIRAVENILNVGCTAYSNEETN